MERQKKRSYNARIQSIEKGTFTPLVFGASGGVARECSIFLSKLADKLATKNRSTKAEMLTSIRRKVSFILIRSVVTCLRGERASRSFTPSQMELQDPKLTELNASFF